MRHSGAAQYSSQRTDPVCSAERSCVLAALGLSASPGFVLLAAFLFFCGGWAAVTALFTSVLAHELGHLTAILLSGAEVRRLRFGAAGAVIDLDGSLSRRQEMAIAAAGPVAGLLFACICVFADTPYFRYVSLVSLLASAFNLLPVYPMDGGRVAYLAMCGVMPEDMAERILRVVGTICGILVAGTGVMLHACSAAAIGIWMTVLANAPGLR